MATGGEIFFALLNGVAVGTCAVIKLEPKTVELAKLAVVMQRGRGIGKLLTEASIAWAREQGAQKVVLLSSTRREAALRLYEQLGFRHGPLPANAGYETADVYMELLL